MTTHMERMGQLVATTRERFSEDVQVAEGGEEMFSAFMDQACGAAVALYVAEMTARAIEESVCGPGPACADKFCQDCIRHAQAQRDAALLREWARTLGHG